MSKDKSDIIEKKYFMNEEILKKLGYNSIALEMLLKREAQINPEDILMPGERPNLNRDPSLNDLASDVEDQINDILNKLEDVKRILNDLPEYTIAEEGYDEDVRAFPMHKKFAKEELENLIEEIKQLQRYA